MNTVHSFVFALAFVIVPPQPRQPATRIEYTLRIDSADLSGITVDMTIHGTPAEFRVAMVAHTEYDDEYWRYLVDLRGESALGKVEVTREDSSLWRVNAPAGKVTLHYRLRFPVSPPMRQASWMAHLTPTGGLVGGPHSFLYVLGAEHAPVTVTVQLPNAWRIVTGLATSTGPNRFTAPGVEALVDSPMLVGLIRIWPFTVDGVPHQIAYLGRNAGTTFDTALFVSNVKRLAAETVRMFGRMPYDNYQFLFEDGAYGGLEHLNSVSIGVQSANLTRDPNSMYGQIAHEFFHTWNEVHLRPMSWIGVRRVPPEPTGELWWSEGVTLYFADLLLRRAGLYSIDSTRVARLERLISNYLANPSHALVSPGATSRAFNQPPDATGDYTPNMFSQGELLGAMLDLMIREGSGGHRSLDDAMRALSLRFSIARGFGSTDLEDALGKACGCEVRPFFDTYVNRAGALDFNRWLGVVGLHSTVSWTAALSADGAPAPDLRISTYAAPGDATPRLKVWFPGTLWGRAGVHTGDRVELWNGVAVRDVAQLRELIGRLHVDDTVRVSLRRDSARVEKTILIGGYQRPTVRIENRSDATAAQRRLQLEWMAAR